MVRLKKMAKSTDSMRIWTWRPGIAAQFEIPSRYGSTPGAPHAQPIIPVRSEDRAFEYALDRWLNEGGRDVRQVEPLRARPHARARGRSLPSEPRAGE
jgi:hypothetical protein